MTKPVKLPTRLAALCLLGLFALPALAAAPDPAPAPGSPAKPKAHRAKPSGQVHQEDRDGEITKAQKGPTSARERSARQDDKAVSGQPAPRKPEMPPVAAPGATPK